MIKMHEATVKEISKWNQLIVQNPDGGEALQTREWGEFKGRHGWKPRYFIYELGKTTVAVMFLTRFVMGFGELWYCPKGPGVANVEQFLKLAQVTKSTLNDWPNPPFLVKFDPEIIEDADTKKKLNAPLTGLKKAALDVHISRATIKVDLKPSLDDIIAKFKSKTRYNVRLSERKGVKVESVEPTKQNFDIMYDLITKTQQRAGFIVRSKSYCIEYWRAQIKADCAQLFFASNNDVVLAGAFVTKIGDKAWYKDGGSRRDHNELMAPYLLQWEIMKSLKANGVVVYDFVGIPPRERRVPEDPMYGLFKFKQGFGGRVEQFIGAWDLPINDVKYKIWTSVGERALLKYYNKVKNALWY
jgi:lipid II:glycine glycyltransferase (peptidoglycan interpeptide bridge formation enzyme)